ncbi:MAG: spore coat protein [Negativicutes bacterium]|nr:spore coat protein [Negativicutes bacterium]
MVYRSRNSTSSRNRLSDRDMLFDMLTTGKCMSHLYDHAIMESSHSMIRETFETLQHSEHEMAETLFNLLEQEGWYTASSRPRSELRLDERNQPRSSDVRSNPRSITSSGTQRYGRHSSGSEQPSRSGRSQSRAGANSQLEWTL